MKNDFFIDNIILKLSKLYGCQILLILQYYPEINPILLCPKTPMEMSLQY